MSRSAQLWTAGSLAVVFVGGGCQLIGGFEDHELVSGGGGVGGQGSTSTNGASGGEGGTPIGGAGGTQAGSTSATGGGGPGICGDGTRNAGEECDDGNSDDNDGCTNRCGIDCEVFQGFVLNPANGHCYFVYPEIQTFDFANTVCSTTFFQGTLVTVTSDEEQAFLADVLQDYDIGRFWLGAERVGPGEDDFEWLTKEPWQYTKWGDGEPDSDPALDANDQALSWGARPPSAMNAVVCERSPGIPL